MTTTRIRAVYVVLVVLGFSGRSPAQEADPPLTPRELKMLERIEQLERRLDAIEGKTGLPTAETAGTGAPADQSVGVAKAALAAEQGSSALAGLAGTTLNFNFDGYYGYNFNRPVGRVNLLRANDVTSNNFTIGQADIVIERAVDPAEGRRLGLRLDLMFGQNTETLQGSTVNELRPQVYRNIFQAYGTYVLPVGSGLTVDFGKFASSLGYEYIYVKDQINYSRAYCFNFLPFYHMGFRTTYKFNDKLSAQYWLVNGANQTEGFNGFKSNAFLFTLTPVRTVSWNIDYFFGQQGRDTVPDYNPGLPVLPTQPGLSTTPVLLQPTGREHIIDSYATWYVMPRLLAVVEGDYVINRAFANSTPKRVGIGMGVVKYQFVPQFALAGRFEYLSDRGGLFSRATQALKGATLTATYQPRDGFQMRWEYRRDFSNHPFFLTARPEALKKEQDTALLALIWWFGGKQGPW